MLETPIVYKADYSLVYEPSEDSFLFLDLFESLKESNYFTQKSFTNKSPLVLEIGSGSGIISTFMKMHDIIPSSFHIASDINVTCNEQTRKTFVYNSKTKLHQFDTIRCDLATSIKSSSIDLLFFNPPYVPSEEVPDLPDNTKDDIWLDLALEGGKDGMTITFKLLDDLDRVLSVNGEAYILFCARNNHKQVVEQFKASFNNFSVEKVIFRKCGWEELCIYRFIKLS